ncbi:hypothetical protein [Polaromonas aquatica]|uniref:hypothetical protein n=1 Tax=Polaromonas aquatica TaxID=332657 RepID=UPI003D6535A1
MSYVIHIWDQPTPTSWPEAQALFERLWDQRAALNPKFVDRRFELLVQRCVHHNMTPYFLNATHRALQEDSLQPMFGTYPGSVA